MVVFNGIRISIDLRKTRNCTGRDILADDDECLYIGDRHTPSEGNPEKIE